MDLQRFAIGGRVYSAQDRQLQEALAQAHGSPCRPRCLCRADGVEMYIAHQVRYLIKRMPDTGDRHHPSCPSYDPGAAASGLGELIGEAIVQVDICRVDLHVDFPWTLTSRGSQAEAVPAVRQETSRPKRRLSLHALMHLLFERAGLHRWSPAMAGKRNQAVLHKFLMQAAEELQIKGEPLTRRLYVPEAFAQERRTELAERRRAKLAVLLPHQGHVPLAVVLGEYKDSEVCAAGQRVWIRHMPDAPLLADARFWVGFQRRFGPLLEARDADGGSGLRLMMVALIRARREASYEIEKASLMLLSPEWIPLEGVHEAPLVQILVAQHRRFCKPLRYDARTAGAFANALLLDVMDHPVELHLMSPFMTPADREAKQRVIGACADEAPWVWQFGLTMPALPPARVASAYGVAPGQ